jgi:hypothetical protein
LSQPATPWQAKIRRWLKTNDFEVAETDISDLEVGESETIVTDSGKTIDLLRTADGVEIYVDGELMDIPEMGAHGAHHDGNMKIHKKVIIECEVDGEAGEASDCGDEMVFVGKGDIDMEALHEAGDGHKVIIKRMHKECSDDDEGTCEEDNVWVSGGEDFDMTELHEAGDGHRVIKIRKSADGELHVEKNVEKVIVIEKD